jgi:hypothetical protein
MISFLISCKEHSKTKVEDNASRSLDLLDVDRSFSSLSKETGMKAAFIEYIDSNGVLLRPDNMPLTGAAAIDFLIEQNDADYNLTWIHNVQ